MVKNICCLLLFSLALVALDNPTMRAARAAPAMTFTVNSNTDAPDVDPGNSVCETAPGNNVCTLRAAIQEANACAASCNSTINFGLPGNVTYLLSLGELLITNTLTLAGNGAASTIIDGNGSVQSQRVLNVGADAVVKLTGLTVQHGSITGEDGAGIFNSGRLTLDNLSVMHNSVVEGVGAAIYNKAAMTVTNSTISGNMVNRDGAGIFNNGVMAVTNSTINGNQAGGIGGGIFNGASMWLSNSTVSGNESDWGGGIYNSSNLAVSNSTISANLASRDGGGVAGGGSTGGSTSLYNVTIAYNMTGNGYYGSGLLHENVPGTVSLKNSILARNHQVSNIDSVHDCEGTILSQGYNIISIPDPCNVTATTGDQFWVSPDLGPLQNNGGRTQTHALLSGSAAIDAGDTGGCRDGLGALIPTDQRGWARPYPSGGRCDIGAYERGAFLYLPLAMR